MEALGVTAGLNREGLAGVPIVVPTIHPESARHMKKSAFTVIRKDISVSFVVPNNVENLSDPM